MATKILLDTDIGSDIDDALCLAYLLVQPECELVGITTVTGESEKRAMLASVLCKLAAKKIPIFPGIEKPLLISQKQPRAAQAITLKRWEHDKKFPKGEAIEFLRQTIHQYPGEIILLAIGPLTNIAVLFKMDSEIPSLLKGLVIMCGKFTNQSSNLPFREWNAMCDPHAAAIVYQTPVSIHRSIGLDVTLKVRMVKDEVMKNFSHISLLQPVLDFGEVWFRERDEIVFHDPLAASTIFEENICNFQKGVVKVELIDKRLMGKTYWRLDTLFGKHEVALEVNRSRFFEHYFGILQKR